MFGQTMHCLTQAANTVAVHLAHQPELNQKLQIYKAGCIFDMRQQQDQRSVMLVSSGTQLRQWNCAVQVQAAGLMSIQFFGLMLQSNGLEVDVSWDQTEALAKDVMDPKLSKCTPSDQHSALIILASTAAAKCNYMQAKARSDILFCSSCDSQPVK